ncbi:hypothetical protein B0H17DRAFT_1217468 [Mycena rosella]|uniref:Uncharacterized protein n=1 Tax=Mycena rosella TaxID=1033263 RepID=A0AAD7BYA7_MYCRO|nr:hypothetical protein B0H17DRAFT_1217468 [Mycena rosella]
MSVTVTYTPSVQLTGSRHPSSEHSVVIVQYREAAGSSRHQSRSSRLLMPSTPIKTAISSLPASDVSPSHPEAQGPHQVHHRTSTSSDPLHHLAGQLAPASPTLHSPSINVTDVLATLAHTRASCRTLRARAILFANAPRALSLMPPAPSTLIPSPPYSGQSATITRTGVHY